MSNSKYMLFVSMAALLCLPMVALAADPFAGLYAVIWDALWVLACYCIKVGAAVIAVYAVAKFAIYKFIQPL